MSSVAEIEAAIERLSPTEINQLAAWLEHRRQEMLNAFLKTSENATTPKTRSGVPLLPSRGEVITP